MSNVPEKTVAGPLRNIARLAREGRRILTLPRLTIRFDDTELNRATHRELTRRHHKFFLIQFKRWGVALVDAAQEFERFSAGRSNFVLRYNRRQALKAGYSFLPINPLDHLNDVLDINTSADIRQGRPMHPGYTKEDEVRHFFAKGYVNYGITSADGRLVAYASIVEGGEVWVIERMIGHVAHLKSYVMWLLASEVVRVAMESNRASGKPRWVMYDTMNGGLPGMVYFKERLGFTPYNVDWKLGGPN